VRHFTDYDEECHSDIFVPVRDVLMPGLPGTANNLSRVRARICSFCEALLDGRELFGVIPTEYLDGTADPRAVIRSRADTFVDRMEVQGLVSFAGTPQRNGFRRRVAGAAEGCLMGRGIRNVHPQRLDPPDRA